MTEQRIKDGFDRLARALAPPADVASRVEQAVRTRRRRRRGAAVGVSAVVLAAGVAGAVLVSGGDDAGGDVVAADPGGPHGSFTLTRADGSTITLDDLTLTCDQAPGDPDVHPGHIYLSSPFRLDASQRKLVEPYVSFDAVAAQVDGRDFVLPPDSDTGDSEDRAFVLFAADAGRDANEVSSAEPGASGTLRVLRASCDPTPVLELEVDGSLGSEVDAGAWAVQGSYG
jgi:hypothetical protein